VTARAPERTMSALTACIGERVEIARYRVRDTERIICAERIDDHVHVTDRPSHLPGRCYLIEVCACSEVSSSLQALVVDYTRQARRLEDIPMLAGAVTGIDQVVLARYCFTGGQRMLCAQRVNGAVRVTDRPASGPERSYLVEWGLECDDYSALQGLVADYVEQAGSSDAIPMASSHVRRIVEEGPATRCPRSPAAEPARRRPWRPRASS